MKTWKVEIEELQQQILNQINPVLLSNTAIMKLENWFSSHPTVHKYSQDNNLIFSNTTDKANYISLLEKNTYFKSFPQELIPVLENEHIHLHFDAEVIGKASVHIAIIEYSHVEKRTSTLYSIQAPITHTLSDMTKEIRIAMKISGKGMVILKKGEIKRIDQVNKNKDISKAAPQQLLKKVTKINDLTELKMAVIFDEFTMSCYQEEVKLITFSPENFKAVLEEQQPDLLFVESAWRGNGGSWEFKIAKYANQDKEALHQLLQWCKSRGIPTVFWNKEDPIHFEKFIETAELFDYIYTTDANMIENYQNRAKHKNVYALPFSAQPRLHNPIRLKNERKDGVSFAGSYYGNRHVERRNDMEEVLEVATIQGLDIFDRNYEKNKEGRTDFSFPERFQKSVQGSLPYKKIPLAYKGYKYMVNVNSIKYSPTMFSRRVFEGLASGTPIISSYSEGIKRFFGDIVMIGDDTSSLEEKFRVVLDNDQLYEQKRLAGIREVMLHHTYQNRLSLILKNIGITYTYQNDVTIIVRAKNEKEAEKAKLLFESQLYPAKKLILLTTINAANAQLMNQYNTSTCRIYHYPYLKNIPSLSDLIDTKYSAYIDLQHFYGKHYLEDMIASAIYSEADIIVKKNHFLFKKNQLIEQEKGLDYQFVSDGGYGQILFKTEMVTSDNVFELFERMAIDDSLASEFSAGKRLFSSDRFNFIKQGGQCPMKFKNQVEK